MIVGLTGGIGSGKTTVAKLFGSFNSVAIYIADVEAKKLMATSKVIQTKIINLFGEQAYQNNVLDRKFIGNIVFKNKEKLQQLNAIVHPEVKKHFKEFVAANANKTYIIYESAILFESNSQHQFDYIISVFVDLETRIQRVLERDTTTKKEVLERIHNQWKEDKKLLLSNYIIINNLLENTKKQVNYIHKILTKKTT